RPFESEQFHTAARLMCRRQVDEYYRLDVDASIASTIDALGYPSFRYKAASKMPDYLVLIERASFRDHQAQLFNELAKALEREAIFLVRYFYDGDPRVCRSGARDSIHLVELQRKHPQHRLLIFGNGDRLIDPITGKLESWASVFSAWRERAVLTPEIPSRWGAREVALAGQFIIAPATLDGLASVIDQFEATVMTDLRVWRRNAFEAPPDEREQYGSVHFLHSYLGEEAFQWLCACAVYPELHWDLTVHLGSLECMKEGLVRAENLQRLVHLPWFRSGTIPDELRWLLIRQLDKHREKAVRLALVALLEKNPPPKGTFAYDDYQLDLVVQQWLSRRDRKTAREVLRKMAELPSSQVTRDYTVLRFLDSSRISPLDMVLPRQFRKRLYHNWELLYLPIAAAVLEFSKKQLVKARVFVASVHRYVDSVTLPLLATEHRKRVAAFATAAVLLVTGWGGFYLFKSSLNRAPVNSVAILPFANQTGDQRMDAIGDEIAEGIINHLYQVKNLRVISYGDVEQYKGPELDLQAIGRELGVNAVMIGRISMRDGAFTVTAELVDAGDKSRIWSQQEKLRFADLMSAHSRLARSVLDKLGVRLSEEESKELDAEQLYETGRNSLSQRTPEGFNKAIEYFDKAVALKPDYALAHAGLADCYNMLATYGALAPSEAFPKAKSEAQKALEIDDTLAEAHVSLAYALFRGDWKWAESEREFRQALVLNSKLAQAHQWYANLLVALGRSDEAIAQTWRAQELDSTSSIIRSNVALVYIYAHRYDDSIAACQKFLELDPTYFAARRYLGQAYAQKGKYDLAISELQRAVATNGSPLIRAELAYTYARAAKKDEAQKILTDLQRLSSERYISPYHIALIYSGLGNKEETFNWLEQAFQGRTDYLVFLKVDPRFDWLHGDPRFASLLERIGLL
ncbi:MAG TPA: tetratricopeptide repeat protein, partial [Blastocatellia bacterium]|nr:tetratricopeptide repeat protein [Blastocatellia bacterium]